MEGVVEKEGDSIGRRVFLSVFALLQCAKPAQTVHTHLNPNELHDPSLPYPLVSTPDDAETKMDPTLARIARETAACILKKGIDPFTIEDEDGPPFVIEGCLCWDAAEKLCQVRELMMGNDVVTAVNFDETSKTPRTGRDTLNFFLVRRGTDGREYGGDFTDRGLDGHLDLPEMPPWYKRVFGEEKAEQMIREMVARHKQEYQPMYRRALLRVLTACRNQK